VSAHSATRRCVHHSQSPSRFEVGNNAPVMVRFGLCLTDWPLLCGGAVPRTQGCPLCPLIYRTGDRTNPRFVCFRRHPSLITATTATTGAKHRARRRARCSEADTQRGRATRLAFRCLRLGLARRSMSKPWVDERWPARRHELILNSTDDVTRKPVQTNMRHPHVVATACKSVCLGRKVLCGADDVDGDDDGADVTCNV
jgi:hypothetical protein